MHALKRRYDLVRKKMKEKGLEVLLASGFRFVAAAGYLRYMTNRAEPFGGEVLVFPLEGAPIFLARTGERAPRAALSRVAGEHRIYGCPAARCSRR